MRTEHLSKGHLCTQGPLVQFKHPLHQSVSLTGGELSLRLQMVVHGTAVQKPGGLCMQPCGACGTVRSAMHQKELVEALLFKSVAQLKR